MANDQQSLGCADTARQQRECFYESFTVDHSGRLTGSIDDSGLTRFDGQVLPDGSFTAAYIRLGGTMSGTIDADGSVAGRSAIRTRDTTFQGKQCFSDVAADGSSFAGEYRISYMAPAGATAPGNMNKTTAARIKTESTPYPPRGAQPIRNRGLKFNLPLDMRTPSYSDSGDCAQRNIPDMWDMDFWHAQLDGMAAMGYNTLSLWNLNPFPSMVKVPEFPDIALDDVWRTTLPFDDTYNGTGTNMVRPEHFQNYEVVKRISIDGKIAFWREVMAYARQKGIAVYLFIWSIYTFGEQGKYGIDHRMDNPTTVAYFRCSVREMIRTYPDLAGLGVVCGEQMHWEDGKEHINEQWLWDTFGRGICDGLAETPERPFRVIHRLHLTDIGLIERIWKELPCPLDYSDKYSIAHMYASTTPTFIRPTVAQLPKGRRLWLEIRNDDIYLQRWGDPDFARQYLAGMPQDDCLEGFMMGSDGYIPGREYASADPCFQRQLFLEKHWFSYLIWGQLAKAPDTADRFFLEALEKRFPGVPARDIACLFKAMAAAGKIIPQVSRLYFQSGDSPWYPEGCLSHPYMFGFLHIKRWMKSRNAMQDAGVMSIAEYAALAAKGQVETSLQTPPQVCQALRQYADQALEAVQQISADTTAAGDAEFIATVRDQQAVSWLGRYYADKIQAATQLCLFSLTGDESRREAAVAALTVAAKSWAQYTDLFSAQYLPQRLPRHGYFDVRQLAAFVRRDIELARTLPTSTVQ